MSARRARHPKTAMDVVRVSIDLLRTDKGQAYSDPLGRAELRLAAIIAAADKVVAAKDLYYHQHVGNDDALELALSAWADRVDALRDALEQAEGDCA